MACKSCAERRARMKAWLQERFRVEQIHKAARQGAAHRERRVAEAEGAGPGGAAVVPDMPEAGEAGASGGRGPQGQQLTQQREVESVGAVREPSLGEDGGGDGRRQMGGEGL